MEQPTGRHEPVQGQRAAQKPPPAPRWVKVSVAATGMLVLLVVVLILTGIGGEHGPGRHFSGGGVPAVSVEGR